MGLVELLYWISWPPRLSRKVPGLISPEGTLELGRSITININIVILLILILILIYSISFAVLVVGLLY